VSRPVISVIHPTARVAPSASFPIAWRGAHDAYLAACAHPEHVEYILVVHESRWRELDGSDLWRLRPHGWGTFRLVVNTGRDCVVDQLNTGADRSTGAIVHASMDDLLPPEHWDSLLIAALRGPLVPDVSVPLEGLGSRLLVCSSGASPERDRELMLAGAITRQRLEQTGTLLDPDFESMFADNYFAYRARQDEKAGLVTITERLDIVFEHRHPVFGTSKVDSVYRQQNREAAYMQGQATFLKKVSGTKSLAVLSPGESFRSEIMWDRVRLLFSLQNMQGKFFVLPFGQWSTNVYTTRIHATREILNFLPNLDLYFTVDDDNTCTPEQFLMLYEDLMAHPELDGVVGWCWCDNNEDEKTPDGRPNPWKMSVGRQGNFEDGMPAWNFTQADFLAWAEQGRTLITSDDLAPNHFWSGLPIALFRGDLMRRMGPLAFRPVLNDKFVDGFCSEDAAWFFRCTRQGAKFGVDLRVRVEHMKYRGIKPQYIPQTERAQAKRFVGEYSQGHAQFGSGDAPAPDQAEVSVERGVLDH